MMYKCASCGNAEESVEAAPKCSKCGSDMTVEHDESSVPMADSGSAESGDNV